ncbi:peroxidase 60-like [Dorcoceras hygrometricum]|uniref:Peroxidase n=1 Tax=Dorcoceras hygrometricum TaxID=472368 RepID=A0A2Z7A7A0_9LAMI|nr:peroxidase 60-like [Dorcoceras hygrometricum]
MSKGAGKSTLAAVFVIFFAALSGRCNGDGLQVGFYRGKCRFDVEKAVEAVISAWYRKDPTITPALLRMQFHDCFVNGCDASILLDGSNSEKVAFPNLSVRGYEIIEAAKRVMEAFCPRVVSCADIIVMATRDAVALSGGGRYAVETGRRDGTVSLASNVNLPPPSISVSDSIKAFEAKGLSATDMVYLLGGHTVGIAHCSLFLDRLYNFKNTGKPDPTMDSKLLATLRARCPQNATVDNTVNLDQNPLSSLTVDNSYSNKYSETVLPSNDQKSRNPLNCIAKIIGGPKQLYTSSKNYVAVVSKANKPNHFTTSKPLNFYKPCRLKGKCGDGA